MHCVRWVRALPPRLCPPWRGSSPQAGSAQGHEGRGGRDLASAAVGLERGMLSRGDAMPELRIATSLCQEALVKQARSF